jgi:hypothetical protein
MSWTKCRPVGLAYADPNLKSEEYTLFSNIRGKHATLVDMRGQIVHQWHSDEGIQYPRLLPNGNLLMHTSPPKDAGGAEKIGGSSGALLELDWESNIVWEYRHEMMHHDFVRLPNGNHLLLMTQGLPDGLTAKVKGGRRHEEDPEVMWGDKIVEITPEGKIIYEWRSWEHLDLEQDVICPLETRREWTHVNALNLTPNGDMLISLRCIDIVAIIDRKTGDFKWKWGRDELSHQHHPTYLDTGKILIFDNGPHRFKNPAYSRIIEVDPETNEIGWQYRGDPLVAFNSFAISGVERLANGNTLICEGVHGRYFEVTPDCEVVWEYINPFFTASRYGRTSSTFRVHRYAPGYPGLQGKELDPARYADLNDLINSGKLTASEGGILVEGTQNVDEDNEKKEAQP